MSDKPELDLKKDIAAVGTAFEEFKKANDEALASKQATGTVDPILEEKLARIDGDIDKAQARLDANELAMKRAARNMTDATGDSAETLDKKAQSWLRAKDGRNADPEFNGESMTAYKSAFNTFLRKGDQTMHGEELKALSVGVDADGGFVVEPDLGGQIVKQVFETSMMRAYASIQTISTNSLEGLHDQEDGAAGWVAETAARTTTATPQIAKWSIDVHEMYANPKATQKVLDDAYINLEAWLAEKTASKMARLEATAFVTGSGTGEPQGFLSYAAGTTLPLQIEQISTGVDAGYAAAPNGGDILIDAVYGLKAEYRNAASWFMNRQTAKLTRKLKDTDGSYLWSAGIALGQPATLMGYGVASFEDMPDPAVGSLSLAFGDMRSAYQIVDRQGIRVLRDPYTDKPYIGFYSVKRVGGGVVNAEALKIVKFAV